MPMLARRLKNLHKYVSSHTDDRERAPRPAERADVMQLRGGVDHEMGCAGADVSP